MNHSTPITTLQPIGSKRPTKTIRSLAGGLPVRTNLRAGLAWDDLDDKAQELLNNLTNALSGLVGGDSAS